MNCETAFIILILQIYMYHKPWGFHAKMDFQEKENIKSPTFYIKFIFHHLLKLYYFSL